MKFSAETMIQNRLIWSPDAPSSWASANEPWATPLAIASRSSMRFLPLP